MIPIVIAAAISTSPAATVSCEPISGAAEILTDQQMRWLILGEQHGTAESPRIFADIVCLATKLRREIVVGLEFPVEDQKLIDAYLASNGGDKAQAALLSSPVWQKSMQDGRSSGAMLALFERLRKMARAKHIVGVAAFQNTREVERAKYEQGLANQLQSASPSRNRLVIALVGNFHARTLPWSSGGQSYMPMAGLLPKEQTRTLNIVGNGGAQWACFRDRSAPIGDQPTCAARDFGVSSKTYMRGIVLASDSNSPYAGTLYLGVPTTAARPALAK